MDQPRKSTTTDHDQGAIRFEPKDRPLRRDVGWLGALLGRLLRELAPPGVPVIATGEVTVECEFRDAMSHRLDAVANERSKGSRWLNETPWSTWSDVTNSFDQWARGIRKAIDEGLDRTLALAVGPAALGHHAMNLGIS